MTARLRRQPWTVVVLVDGDHRIPIPQQVLLNYACPEVRVCVCARERAVGCVMAVGCGVVGRAPWERTSWYESNCAAPGKIVNTTAWVLRVGVRVCTFGSTPAPL